MVNLGDRVVDKISGLKGIVIGITEWLYGCRRVTISPETAKDGKPAESFTIDDEQADLVKATVLKSSETTAHRKPAGPRNDAPRGHSVQ